MPKTEAVEVKVMDVRAHMKKREEIAARILKEKSEANKIDKVTMNEKELKLDLGESTLGKNDFTVPKTTNNGMKEATILEKRKEPEVPVFDLEKELEKKFDELFGETDNH